MVVEVVKAALDKALSSRKPLDCITIMCSFECRQCYDSVTFPFIFFTQNDLGKKAALVIKLFLLQQESGLL